MAAGKSGNSLLLRAKDECKWDLVSLGEVMLRLDPGDVRVATARQFNVWEGGGEYNVARGLRRCFGLRTAIVTALADNPVGRLLEDLMLQGGVFSGDDADRFIRQPFAADAVRLRIWDDRAKRAGATTPPLAHFLDVARGVALTA